MRALDRVFVLEGTKVIGAALDAGTVPEALFVGWGAQDDPVVTSTVERAQLVGSSAFTLSPGVLEKVSDTVTPQPLLAIVRQVDVDLATIAATDRMVLVCTAVRDPGNAGTILRSAAGAGAGGVVFCEGSVDPYNPKTVRASAGAIFQVPICQGGGALEVIDALRREGFRLVGAAPAGGTDYVDCDLTGRVALVLGNEAWGIAPEVTAPLEEIVTITLAPGTESLNVGIAASILCFESSRQRRQAEVRL